MRTGGGEEPEETLSPYQAVLGRELVGLHPALRRYFSAIPAGHDGVGNGTWERVGTPRRWLWPVLAVLAREGIVFPKWGRDVPFSVTNTPSSSGEPAVHARRVFRFPSGERVMVDRIETSRGDLVDRLGHAGRLEARLGATVVDGALTLVSTALHIRIGRGRLRVPRMLAPRVRLTERFDDASGRQHVSLVLTMPVLGTLYEYSGYFDYRIEAAPHGERPPGGRLCRAPRDG